MDHYNEQMVQKQTQPKDVLLRILIVTAGLLLVFVSVFASVLFQFTPLVLISVGILYLAYILFTGTFTEYEYIVTNNDLDIDRIIGKRKRKRLITVKLNTVTQWGEYTGKEGNGISTTVMASDASGNGSWYIIADHSNHGRLMIIFSPSKKTINNINFGVPHSAKKKLNFKTEDEETE